MPRAFGYESHECLSAEVPQDWGKQHLRSWRATQCLVYTKSQGQSSAFLRAWARPSCWSWRVSWGRQGRLGLTVGTDTGGRSAGDSSSVRALLGCHQDLAHPNACRLWCWDPSGQTTSMVGTQPLPSADWLPKDFLSTSPLPQPHPPAGVYQLFHQEAWINL